MTSQFFLCAGLILEESQSDSRLPFSPSVFRVGRALRLARLLRVVRQAKGLRRLLFTFIYALPALVNVGALLLLVMYIYAILGITLFGHIKYNEGITSEVSFCLSGDNAF